MGGEITSCPVDLVDDDTVGLAGPHHGLHLASVGDAGVQGGSRAVVAGVDLDWSIPAVPGYHVSKGGLAEACGSISPKLTSTILHQHPGSFLLVVFLLRGRVCSLARPTSIVLKGS